MTASGLFRSALLTPNRAPVMTLIRTNAITAANAPPARSFAQEPPMATAKRICRLLMTAHPMVSMVLPRVRTKFMSPPAICTSFPTLIISPAAGMTAITVISTLPSFWRKSKLMGNLDFFFLGSGAAWPEPLTASAFKTGPWPDGLWAASSGGHASNSVITVSLPADTGPETVFMVRFSMPPQMSTGVMRLTCFSSSI